MLSQAVTNSSVFWSMAPFAKSHDMAEVFLSRMDDDFLKNLVFIIPAICIIISWFLSSISFRSRRIVRELSVSCQSSVLNEAVSTRLKYHVGEYMAPWWYNRHIGTILPLGYFPNLVYEREIFTVADGCFAVDWYPRKPAVADDRDGRNSVSSRSSQRGYRPTSERSTSSSSSSSPSSSQDLRICVFYPGLSLGSGNVRSELFGVLPVLNSPSLLIHSRN
jgi:hypothetical protein